MRRLFLLLTAVLLLVFALTSCGGGGSAGGDTPSASPLYYANWWCTTNQCSSVMGGNSGSAGPFISLNACEQWRQNYILTSVCETSPGGGSSDLTPPTISSSNPSNGTTGVAVNTAISVTFSEAMDPASVTGTSFTVMTGSTAVPGSVNYSGTTATFTPTGSLAYSTSYTATVTTGAKDLAGNALAANYVWNFNTGTASDTTPPMISSTSPASGATGVGVNTAISVTFSEAMDPASVTGTSFTVMTGSTAVPGSVNYSGTTATFTPTGSLAYSTSYTATVTTGAKDLAGNALASNHAWGFGTTTAPPPTKHYIFITSLSYDGDLKSAGGGSTGLEGADKICANHAAGGALGGTWKAWLSDSTTNAIDRINDVGPWYLVGTDTVVFNNKANLATVPLIYIYISELGIAPPLYTNAWTGTLTGGTKSTDLCADWTNNTLSVRGLRGYVYLVTTNWTQSASPTCNSTEHLYCIQQ